MFERIQKIIAITIISCFVFEQSGFAQVAPQMGIPAYLRGLVSPQAFRPMHMRSMTFDDATQNVNLLIDTGDAKNVKDADIKHATRQLMDYFQVGLRLPNSMFWVNLRPDTDKDIIDPYLETTDVGRVLLEADLQLKKDLAKFTSPRTKEGKAYWDKLYAKADSIFGQQDIIVPTLTRPWILPGEILIKQAQGSAYVYKATLKVMLEQDYIKDSPFYSFDDPRLKELNEYSSELIRALVLPQLTREVNSAKRYAPLRQVYYSLVLAQWFKQQYKEKDNAYASKIDTMDLSGLTSKKIWSKAECYKGYQKSFQQGEYDIEETATTGQGLVIRRYFSGGIKIERGPETMLGSSDGGMPTGMEIDPDLAEVRTQGNGEITVVPGQAAQPEDGGSLTGHQYILMWALQWAAERTVMFVPFTTIATAVFWGAWIVITGSSGDAWLMNTIGSTIGLSIGEFLFFSIKIYRALTRLVPASTGAAKNPSSIRNVIDTQDENKPGLFKYGDGGHDVSGQANAGNKAESRPVVIAFSLGGTKLAGASFYRNAGLRNRPEDITWESRLGKIAKQGQPEDIVGAIVDQIDATLKSNELSAATVQKIGIAFAGPVDPESGVVGTPFAAPNLPFDHYPLKAVLESCLKEKYNMDIAVEILNDASAALMGERAGMVLIDGTGVNGAVAKKGKPYFGESQEIVELGHNIIPVWLAPQGYVPDGYRGDFIYVGKITRGDHPKDASGNLLQGDFEDMISGPNLDKKFREAGYTLMDITQRAMNGEYLAKRGIQNAGEMIGKGLAAFIWAYKDEPFVRDIVLISGVSENLGKGLVDENGNDMFVESVRNGARQDLIKLGLSEQEAGNIVKGIRRSTDTYEREFKAFTLHSKDGGVQNLTAAQRAKVWWAAEKIVLGADVRKTVDAAWLTQEKLELARILQLYPVKSIINTLLNYLTGIDRGRNAGQAASVIMQDLFPALKMYDNQSYSHKAGLDVKLYMDRFKEEIGHTGNINIDDVLQYYKIKKDGGLTMVKLKNGAEEAEPVVKLVVMSIRTLLESGKMEDTLAFFDLVSKARDPRYKVFSPVQENILKRLALLQPDGNIHESIRNVVLSAVVGESFEMRLVSPVAAKEVQSSAAGSGTQSKDGGSDNTIDDYEGSNADSKKRIDDLLTGIRADIDAESQILVKHLDRWESLSNRYDPGKMDGGSFTVRELTQLDLWSREATDSQDPIKRIDALVKLILFTGIKMGDYWNRWHYGLASINDPAAVDHLIDVLRREYDNPKEGWLIRAPVIQSLAQMKDARAVDPIGKALLADRIFGVRVDAAEALGVIGNVNALPYLTKAQEDRSEKVRAAAQRAIKAIEKKNRSAETSEKYDGGGNRVADDRQTDAFEASYKTEADVHRWRAIWTDRIRHIDYSIKYLKQIKFADEDVTGKSKKRDAELRTLNAIKHSTEAKLKKSDGELKSIWQERSRKQEALNQLSSNHPTIPDSPQGDRDGGTVGGIDMRTLPIVTAPAGKAAASASVDPAMQTITLRELDKRWAVIRKKIDSGPMPYAELKEFAAVCSTRKDASRQLQAVSCCVVRILKMEEAAAVMTAPEFIEIVASLA
jgi:predicted NBD/HSP70 family sugar kinase